MIDTENFADFASFCSETYARTKQYLPPLVGGNKEKTLNTIITF